ncbi:MAG: hypothetical protein HGA49_11485 [Eubacteriaceae bacterium]|nr:hypothetical protein [Eubacteriaceae bacterium]
MKALVIDLEYYYYPDEIVSIEEFVECAGNCTNRFVKLRQISTENCIAPYFIDTDVSDCYINLNLVNKISETEIFVLTKKEYDEKLTECVSQICNDCIYFKEDNEREDLNGFRDKLDLNCHCPFKTLYEIE